MPDSGRRGGAVRRPEQKELRGPPRGSGGALGCLVVGRKHDVEVCAAEAERRDGGLPLLIGPRARSVVEEERALGRVVERVGTTDVEGGRQRPVVERERALDEPREAGCTLGVSDL